MALNIEEMREEAWKNVVHAEGTHEIFASRLRRLRALTDLRDWFGFLAIPSASAFVATTEIAAGWESLRHPALQALATAAFVQALLAGWSLIRRWDDTRAYCARAIRDSFEMREAWTEIAKGDGRDLKAAYELRRAQQKIVDSHDIEREISIKEKQFGMRCGLIALQWKCAGCNKVPNSRRPPLLVKNRCPICGGDHE